MLSLLKAEPDLIIAKVYCNDINELDCNELAVAVALQSKKTGCYECDEDMCYDLLNLTETTQKWSETYLNAPLNEDGYLEEKYYNFYYNNIKIQFCDCDLKELEEGNE